MTDRLPRSAVAARMGRTIRLSRRRQHLSQADLAQRIVALATADGHRDVTCDRSSVAHWEAGDWCPDLRLWPHIAKALGFAVDLFHDMDREAA